MNELKKQIEAAFDYRGHVTIAFKSGERVEGFLYNREFANPLSREQGYVEVILKDKEDRKRYPISSIESVALTGEDCAAGNSYADYLSKKAPTPAKEPPPKGRLPGTVS